MQKSQDLATFPALFDDMETFFDEQVARLKRAGLLTASITLSGSVLLFYLGSKAA